MYVTKQNYFMHTFEGIQNPGRVSRNELNLGRLSTEDMRKLNCRLTFATESYRCQLVMRQCSDTALLPSSHSSNSA